MYFKKFFAILIGLFLVAAIFSGCGEQNAYAPPPPATVTIAKPQIKDTTYYLYKSGRFNADHEVVIVARVAGVLEQRLFLEGRYVEEGDVLFIIEQTAYKAQLEEARAALNAAYAQNREAKAALDRKKTAFQQRAVSEIDVIQAQAQYDQTVANIQNAKAMVATAELNLSYTEVRAPISGRVSRAMVDTGNMVGPTQNTILTTIVNDESLQIYFSVTENELAVYLRDGAPRVEEKTEENKERFLLNAGMGQQNSSNDNAFPFEGQLDFVDNAVNTETGTILLRGNFENHNKKIVAGMFARVRIPLRMIKDALTVPEIALGQNQAGYFVYTVDENNIVHRVNVNVAFIQEGVAVIESGLAADANIIVNGMSRVQDGAPANPMTAEQLAKAQAAQAQAAQAAPAGQAGPPNADAE